MIEEYARLSINDIYLVLRGIWMTLSVTLISIAIGTCIGSILGLICTSKNKIVANLPLIYIEPLRNSPLITQIFLIYYGLPMVVGFSFKPFAAGILSLSLNTGAFFAVLLNTSVRAVPQAYRDAGLALGHSKASVFVRIVLPQAVRILLPQAITLYVGQLQCSSFVSIIALMDLTKVGLAVTQRTLMPFAIWGIVFAIYYVISYPLTRFAKHLEKRLDFAY